MKTAEERFWAKVRKTPGCWEWTAYANRKGYGELRVEPAGASSPMMLAHRFSYEIAHGPIPEGLFVLHSCDNPRCVNPVHLRLGTLADNTRDAIERNRAPQNVPREFCSRGHRKTPETTYRQKGGSLACTICNNITARRRYRKVGNFAARKTHCPHGHAYDAANTYTDSEGARHCRACGRENRARYRRARET